MRVNPKSESASMFKEVGLGTNCIVFNLMSESFNPAPISKTLARTSRTTSPVFIAPDGTDQYRLTFLVKYN